MNMIKEIALKYFITGEKIRCGCGGGHEFCLDCRICRAEEADKPIDKIDDLAAYIDHTILKPDTITKDVKKICSEAKEHNFKAVCVNPLFISLCHSELDSSGSLVCSVVSFPLGANLSRIKGEEARLAIKDGAQEIDMVNNIAAVRERDISNLLEDLGAVSDVCRELQADLKVIIETCLLTDEEKIIACLAAKKAGALFVKTSTGFSSGGATVDDVALMRKVVGPKLGVKASGGVKTTEIAIKMIEAGANRIGTSSGVSLVKEFGK